jgi:enoyl-CoA hydratase/carnithine racemase
MSMNFVTTEIEQDYARVRLTSGITNVLTTEVITELSTAVREAEANARGIMLCGGENFFSNGLNLDWGLAQSSAGMRTLFLELGNCVLSIMESPIPIVRAIKGHAIGAGMALLLACDYRYGATGRVLVGKPKILIGVPNPYFADQLLRFVAGDFIASDLIYSDRLVTAEQACSLNLIHGVDEKANIETVAWQQLAFLCELEPEAFAETKRMRSGRFCADAREQMSTRVDRQVEIFTSDTAQIRLREAAKRLLR